MIEARSIVSLFTPNGRPATFITRPGTNDENVCLALNTGDEYRMHGRKVRGWAIDVGAHIGAWCVSAALDNPGLRILAVEAVPDNCDILEENVARNGVSDQITVVRAAAGAPGQATVQCHWGYKHHESADDGYINAHRFVANTWVDQAEPEFGGDLDAVSLDTLLERYEIGEVTLLKIDCEGCEWLFLDSPAVARVQTIVGEYHGGYTGHTLHHGGYAQRDFIAMLTTHDVTPWREEPIIGTFEAVRR